MDAAENDRVIEFPLPDTSGIDQPALSRLDESQVGAGARSISFWLAPFYEAMMTKKNDDDSM